MDRRPPGRDGRLQHRARARPRRGRGGPRPPATTTTATPPAASSPSGRTGWGPTASRPRARIPTPTRSAPGRDPPGRRVPPADERRPVLDGDLLVHLRRARAPAVGPALPVLPAQPRVCAAAAYAGTTGGPAVELRYAKNFWHLPIPDQPLSDIALPNGIHYRCVEPLSRLRARLRDPDDGSDRGRARRSRRCAHPTAWASPISTSPAATRARSSSRGTRSPSTPSVSATARGDRGRSSAPPCTARAPCAAGTATRRRRSATASTPSRWTSAAGASPSTGTCCGTASTPRWRAVAGEVLERRPAARRPAVALELTDELGRTLQAEGRTVNRIGTAPQPEPVHLELPHRVVVGRRAGVGRGPRQLVGRRGPAVLRRPRQPRRDRRPPGPARSVARGPPREPPRSDRAGPRRRRIAARASTGYSAETVDLRRSYDAASGPTERPVGPAGRDARPARLPPAGARRRRRDRHPAARDAGGRQPAIPVAEVLAAEDDPNVIGAPFFVMDFVEGVVPAVDPPYTVTGFFADASPDGAHGAGRRRPARAGRPARARLAGGRAVVAGAAGRDAVAGPPARRVGGLRRAGARRAPPSGPGRRVRPAAPAPARAGRAPAVCWGDPRPGNMIWRDFRCVCVTDFEAAAIAPPELDLGWWLMFDRTCHEVVGAPRLDGEPTPRGAGGAVRRGRAAAMSATPVSTSCSPPPATRRSWCG